MIFKRQMVEAIFAGVKTQTRRPVRDGELECRLVVGNSYAIQPGRGKKALGPRMRITEQPRRELLGDITYEDARAEGFKRIDKFFAYWEMLYGELDLTLEVWVIAFEVEREPMRLLAPSRSQGDYLEFKAGEEGDSRRLRAIDDAEALTAAELEQMAEANNERFANNRQPYLETEQLKARVRNLRRAGTEAGVDVSGDIRVIEQRLTKIGKKIQGVAA